MNSGIDKIDRLERDGILKIVLLSILLACVGAALVFFQGAEFFRRHTVVWTGSIAEGTVRIISVEGSRKSRRYTVVVAYTGHFGRGVQTAQGSYRHWLPFLVPASGETISIAYDPGDRRNIEPVSTQSLGMTVAAFRLFVVPALTLAALSGGAAFLYLAIGAGIAGERSEAAFFRRKLMRRRMPLEEKRETRPPPREAPPFGPLREQVHFEIDGGEPPRQT
jgi:hypothetical protein